MRLIDADALKEHIVDLPTWWADGGGVYPGSMKYPEGMFDPEDIVNSIDNAPTINPDDIRPHGRWIIKGQEVYCSECSGESGHNAFGASAFSKHCPNCGACMRGDASDKK